MFKLRNICQAITKHHRMPDVSKFRPYHVLLPVVIGLGIGSLAHKQVYSDAGEPDEDEKSFKGKKWKTRVYRMMPWRTVSRVWGGVCNLDGPKWTCNSMVSWYVKTWGVDLSEAERERPEDYANLGDLFRRKLKSGARPIDRTSPLVSPCDGKVLIRGMVEDNGELQQVKGLNYSLFNFLGSPSWDTRAQKFLESTADKKELVPNALIKRKPDTETALYYIVIYLAPGDYHRFHSPVNWKISFRRHIRGELLSVNPKVAEWVGGLFTINERVVYVGQWKYGFFSMTPVGATNVGSIHVYEDSDLATNKRKHNKMLAEKIFQDEYRLKKGMDFGEFNLGSTIVLIFEIPKKFKFSVKKGDRVKVGQTLLSQQQYT